MSPDDTPIEVPSVESIEDRINRELNAPFTVTKPHMQVATQEAARAQAAMAGAPASPPSQEEPPVVAVGREVLNIDPDDLTEDDLLAALNDAMAANEQKDKREASASERRRASRPRMRVGSRPGPANGGPRLKLGTDPASGARRRIPTDTRLKIASLEAKLGEAESESEKYQKRLGQMNAETVSYRKRLEDQAERARILGQQDVFRVLISVIDNFESALQQSANANDVDTVLQGLSMVMRQMFNDLKPLGLTTFETVGEPFDPTQHEALRNVTHGVVDPGCVAEQLRRGFLLNGKVFRPAMVAVEAKD